MTSKFNFGSGLWPVSWYGSLNRKQETDKFLSVYWLKIKKTWKFSCSSLSHSSLKNRANQIIWILSFQLKNQEHSWTRLRNLGLRLHFTWNIFMINKPKTPPLQSKCSSPHTFCKRALPRTLANVPENYPWLSLI